MRTKSKTSAELAPREDCRRDILHTPLAAHGEENPFFEEYCRFALFIMVTGELGDEQRIRRILQLTWPERARRALLYELFATLVIHESAERRSGMRAFLRLASRLDYRFMDASPRDLAKGRLVDLHRLIIRLKASGASGDENSRADLHKVRASYRRAPFAPEAASAQHELDQERVLVVARADCVRALEIMLTLCPLVPQRHEDDELPLLTAQAVAGLLCFTTPETLVKHFGTFAPKAELLEDALAIVGVLASYLAGAGSPEERERRRVGAVRGLLHLDAEFASASDDDVADQFDRIATGEISEARALAEIIALLPNGAMGIFGSVADIQAALTHG